MKGSVENVAIGVFHNPKRERRIACCWSLFLAYASGYDNRGQNMWVFYIDGMKSV